MPDDLKRGMSYATGAQIVAVGFLFANTVVLTRSLPSAEYGLFNLFSSAAVTVATMIDVGISSGITRFAAESDADGRPDHTFSVMTSGLTIHAFAFLLLTPFALLFGSAISGIWFDSNASLYGLFLVAILIGVLTNDLVAGLYGLRELKHVAIRIVLQAFLLFGLNLLFVRLLHQGMLTSAAIYVVTNLFLLVWLASYFRTTLKTKRLVANRHHVLWPLIKFGLPLAVVYVMQAVISYAPLLVTKALGGDAQGVNEQIAVVSLAIMLGAAVNSVLSTAVKAGYGYITRWYTLERFRLFSNYVVLIQAFIIAVYGFVVLFTLFVLPRIVGIVFGTEYADTPTYTTLVLLSALMSSSAMLYNSVLNSMAMTRTVMWANGLQFAVYLLAVLALINGWGDASDVSGSLLVIAIVSGFARNIVLIALSYRGLHAAIRRAKIVKEIELSGTFS